MTKSVKNIQNSLLDLVSFWGVTFSTSFICINRENFSTFRLVRRKLCNRLGIDRTTKLVKVYHHLRSNYTLPSELQTD